MRDQELIGLYEAYQQVHTQQRVINEEVEIASHYFCEMGLNEIGVEILIEELGVEEFAEFVYDISEDYYLTEARAGGVKIEPVTTKGKRFADPKKISKSSLARLRAQKEKERGEETSERPSGMKAALQRQDAMVSASKQQPKKKGLLDRVAGAVLQGIERHKAATDGMGAATRETAGKIGKAAGEFRRGLMNSYDNWVGQLISDGYDLSNWTDEGLFEYYEQLCEESLEKGQSPTPGGMIKPKKPVTSAIPPLPRKGTQVNTGYKESYDEPNVLGNIINAGAGAVKKPIADFANRKVGGIPGALGIPGRIAGQKVDQTAQQLKDKDFGGALKTVTGGVRSLMQSYDLYDTILEYLISEGYADTNENALVIMANMSEEWRESIVEDEYKGDPRKIPTENGGSSSVGPKPKDKLVAPPIPVLPPPTRNDRTYGGPAPSIGGGSIRSIPSPPSVGGGSIRSMPSPPSGPRGREFGHGNGGTKYTTPTKDGSAGSITLNKNKPGDDFIGPTVSSGGNTYGIPNPKFGRPQR